MQYCLWTKQKFHKYILYRTVKKICNKIYKYLFCMK